MTQARFLSITVLVVCGAVLAISAVASPFDIRPVNDTRCLARITGGFGLSICDSDTEADFGDPGTIELEGDCVAVPVSTQQNDPWVSGTRLKAVDCTALESSVASERDWLYDALDKQIKADSDHDKCLSITGSFFALRAVIMDCDEFGVTQWELD